MRGSANPTGGVADPLGGIANPTDGSADREVGRTISTERQPPSDSAKLDQIGLYLDQPTAFGPMLANFGPDSTKFGRPRPVVAKHGSNSARLTRSCLGVVPERRLTSDVYTALGVRLATPAPPPPPASCCRVLVPTVDAVRFSVLPLGRRSAPQMSAPDISRKPQPPAPRTILDPVHTHQVRRKVGSASALCSTRAVGAPAINGRGLVCDCPRHVAAVASGATISALLVSMVVSRTSSPTLALRQWAAAPATTPKDGGEATPRPAAASETWQLPF